MNRPKINANDLISFFVPIRCLICDRITNQKNTICIQCGSSLKFSHLDKSINENEMKDLFKGRIDLEKAYYHFMNDEKGVAKKIIHQIKYESNLDLINSLGKSIQEFTKDHFESELILPVPLSRKKEKLRGYNQSQWIAESIFPDNKIQNNLVQRVEHTDSQTGFGKFRRWENMETAFQINESVAGLIPSNASILLVDDVVTTGSTLESIMVQLRNYSKDYRLSLFSLMKA